jgi:hypothetical protein
MQPYFFPHLGHFALIANVDRWVAFDVTQYTPKTWMNRNRVLHPANGWMYVTVPVRGSSRNMTIREVMLDRPDRARASTLGKLAHYRRKAPYFDDVVELVERAFDEREGDSLVALDVASLRSVCRYLGIGFDCEVCSTMGLDLSGVEHAGQWALRIAQQLGAREYVNPRGGSALFRRDEFAQAGIDLSFLDLPPMTYDVTPFVFVPSLSVLDVLMWNDPTDVVSFITRASTFVRPGDPRDP